MAALVTIHALAAPTKRNKNCTRGEVLSRQAPSSACDRLAVFDPSPRITMTSCCYSIIAASRR